MELYTSWDGRQGGQNLPLPALFSPASRSLIPPGSPLLSPPPTSQFRISRLAQRSLKSLCNKEQKEKSRERTNQNFALLVLVWQDD